MPRGIALDTKGKQPRSGIPDGQIKAKGILRRGPFNRIPQPLQVLGHRCHEAAAAALGCPNARAMARPIVNALEPALRAVIEGPQIDAGTSIES